MSRILRNIFIVCFLFFLIVCLILGFTGHLNKTVILGGLTSVVLMIILIIILRPRIGL